MKTLFKKSGIAATAALLILSVMLVIGCAGPETGENEGYKIPLGMGAIKLNFNKEIAARSILPGATTFSSFDTFDFVFTANPSGTTKSELGVDKTNIYDTITLAPGVYKLDVIAYIGSDEAAYKDNITVSITAGQLNTGITITLIPYDPDNNEEGIFAYTITKSGSKTFTATLALTAIGTGTTISPFDVTSDIGDGEKTIPDVKTGYYYVDLTVTETGDNDVVTFRSIVHIYQYLTSSYEFIITDTYFTVRITGVKFSNIKYENPDIPLALSILTTPITAPVALSIGGATKTAAIVIDNAASYSTFGWYCFNTTSLSSASTFTVNTANAPFNIPGNYVLTVVGTTSTGVPYAEEVEITITL